MDLTRAVGRAKARLTITGDMYKQQAAPAVKVDLYTDRVTDSLPEMSVIPDQNITLTSTEIRSPSHSLGRSETLGIRYTFKKHPADVRSSILITQNGFPEVTHIRVPPVHTLETIKEILPNPGYPDAETLRETIIANSPEDHPVDALKRFYQDAREIMYPRHFFSLIISLEENGLPRDILNTPAWWIADWCLGFWGGRRASDEEEVLDIIETIQDTDAFREIEQWGVIGEALCGPVAARKLRADVPQVVQTDVFEGRAWPQIVGARGLALVILTLYGGGKPERARQIARDAPSLTTHETYRAARLDAKHDTHYATAKNKDARIGTAGEAWARLLPTAAEKSTAEWVFVLTNAAYWLAEDARRNGYLRTATALHPTAAGLAKRGESEPVRQKANARAEYCYGLLKWFEDKCQLAQQAFDQTLTLVQSSAESESADTHMWLSAVEQGALVSIRQVQHHIHSLDPTDALSHIEAYREQLPPSETVPPSQQEHYDTVALYLHACQEDLTARIAAATLSKQTNSSTSESSVRFTAADTRELAQRAYDKYQQVDRDYDAKKIADQFNLSR